MAERSRSIRFDPGNGTTGSVRAFSHAGVQALCVVTKITLDIGRQGPATVIAPEPIVEQEVRHAPFDNRLRRDDGRGAYCRTSAPVIWRFGKVRATSRSSERPSRRAAFQPPRSRRA